MYGTCAKSQKTFVEDDLPGLRVFHTERAHTYQPQRSVKGRWIPNRDKTALSQTSSLAYFFGRKLHLELGVPVGIIHSSEGGSPIRAWVPIEGLETQPIFAEFLNGRRTAHGEDPEACGLELSRTGIGNYDAMLHPLVPYALRGFIWHQGEQDGSSGDNYRLMLHALIDGWRRVWNDDTLYVGIGQLYAFDVPYMQTWSERERWVKTQFAQYQAGKEIDRAQCIVLNDFSTPFDIHPKNKLDAAERYAAWALCEAYGRDVLPGGPDPVSAVFDPRTYNFTLTFDHAGDGLRTSDCHDAKWFQIGDSTGRWVGARARFLKDRRQLLVRTNVIGQLKPPYRIRHAWSNVAMPNLVNSAGMPASCFEIAVK
jgi:sialate O-acetylesterase